MKSLPGRFDHDSNLNVYKIKVYVLCGHRLTSYHEIVVFWRIVIVCYSIYKELAVSLEQSTDEQ